MQQELWYIYQNSEQSGPFPKDKVAEMFASNSIAQNAFLFKGGWKDWRPLDECKNEFESLLPPPAPPQTDDVVTRPPRATINGQIIVHNNGELVIGGGVNISSTGIFVETDKALFKVGETLKLTCRVNGISRPFNVDAEVMRFSTGGSSPLGYGLSFVNIDENVAQEIDTLIKSGQLG